MKTSLEHLEKLIAFPSVSRDPNLDLIAYVRDFLGSFGVDSLIVHNEDGRKANLWATIGPKHVPGIVLSGHTDVVPVEGQAWSSDPFRLEKRNGNYFGRGTADMKGFIACCLRAAELASSRTLHTPINLAFSYDEEIGCVGVRRLLDILKDAPVKPRLCIVGEPTLMQAVTAHKGKLGFRVTAHGLEAHSSLAPIGVNAIYMACDLIGAIRAIQKDIADNGLRDGDYEVAYTTLHVGKMQGGEVMNIVPNRCNFDFEIRYLPEDDERAIVTRIKAAAEKIAEGYRGVFDKARFEFMDLQSYPAMNTPVDSEAVKFVHSLTGGNSTGKITFGTEGGLFQQALGTPAVVCGPGNIAVAHKPDEHVSEAQMAQCDRMLERLVEKLAS
ncbi:acetylornithine deacetylase [Aestuariivirga litoralis]|uniref:Acetylornithine deacetylase n=1 Tax=Aestuariivirga litoralis TaxID=2650924 RepID=A0A2W2BC16_9HYPH|nr:acetylornithine deacetylase [Aestuariivirga litoralis]PZF77718.1 acetylornithine deacetylase [Aestuariivirga litoralis]